MFWEREDNLQQLKLIGWIISYHVLCVIYISFHVCHIIVKLLLRVFQHYCPCNLVTLLLPTHPYPPLTPFLFLRPHSWPVCHVRPHIPAECVGFRFPRRYSVIIDVHKLYVHIYIHIHSCPCSIIPHSRSCWSTPTQK